MEEMISQKDVFLTSEGDAWFERNLHGKSSPRSESYDVECICEFCKSPAVGSIDRILEIGCSDGSKLQTLSDRLNAEAFGIDPSSAAVSSGMKRSSKLRLTVGTSDNLPYSNEQFDLVFIGFCLYLVDRDLLADTIRSVNRVLRPGGILAITDFDVTNPIVRDYHHYEGAKTYKCDYPSMFIGQCGYHLGFKSSYSHLSNLYTNDGQERIAISILYKL